MQPVIMEMVKNLKVIFELNARAGDSVLVLTDSGQEPVVWEAIATAGRAQDCEVTVGLMADPRESHNEPPPRCVIEAMKVADLTISATSKEFHTGGFFRYATDAGHRFLIMEQVNSQLLLSPAVKADYKLMNQVGPAIKELMDRGGDWHIVSKSGTDFRCKAKPGTGRWMAAFADANCNAWQAAIAAFPDGEFGVDPVRGSGNGVIVWDTSVHYPPGLLREAIQLTIENGKVTDIEGGVEARQLIEFMARHSNKKNDQFDIELSIGYNPLCPLTGSLRTDKKHFGKIHTAIGDLKMGELHIDGVTAKPTITINGQTIVEVGKILIEPLNTWL